jgi:hypothetical protein
MNTTYIIQKCRKKEAACFKTAHGSDDGYRTLCGIDLDASWAITNNTSDGIITCKKCLNVLKQRMSNE